MATGILEHFQHLLLAKIAFVICIILLIGVATYLYFIYNPPWLSFSETKTITSYDLKQKAGISLLSESIVLFILANASGSKLYILKRDDDYFFLLTKKSESLLKKTKNIHRREIGRRIYKEII